MAPSHLMTGLVQRLLLLAVARLLPTGPSLVERYLDTLDYVLDHDPLLARYAVMLSATWGADGAALLVATLVAVWSMVAALFWCWACEPLEAAR